MLKSQEYITVIGLFLLVGACIILLSTPEDIFSNMMVIDVSRTHKTQYEMLVTTIFDFKNTEELKNLPKNISGLHSRNIETTKTEQKMGAIMKRMYSNSTDGVLFMILSSENMSAFHNLEICYGGRWNITENDVTPIKIRRLGEAGFHNIHVNKFITQRGNLEMVVLHWFMWEGGIIRNEKNYVLLQVAAPIKEDKEETINLTKKFTSDFFLRVYKPVTKSEIIGKQLINKYGLLGVFIDILFILLPASMIFNTKIIKQR